MSLKVYLLLSALIVAASAQCVLYTGQAVVSSNVVIQIKETTTGKWLSQVTAGFSNNPQTLAFTSTTAVSFTIPSPMSTASQIQGKLWYGGNYWDMNGGYGGIYTINNFPTFAFTIIPNGSGGVTLKSVQINYLSNVYTLNIFLINGLYTISYGNLNYGGSFQAYYCAPAPTAAPSIPPSPPPTPAPSPPPTPAPSPAPTQAPCTLYTGQAVPSSNIVFQVKDTSTGKWLTQVTASYSNNPQILAFAGTTPTNFVFTSPVQTGGKIQGLLSYGGALWDINGGIGGGYTVYGSPSFYFTIVPNGSGGVTLQAIQISYLSNVYTLNVELINGQYVLSYGNINYYGTYVVYVCFPPATPAPSIAPTPQPTIQPTPPPSPLPTGPPTAGPCPVYTGQATAASVTFQLRDLNTGLYLAQVTAQFSNNPQTLAFASSTPVSFSMNTVAATGELEGFLSYGGTLWDINGGYGGLFTQNSSPSYYVTIIPNGSGGVSIEAIQNNYQSNIYSLNLFIINGQSTLSYGNINGAGNFVAYVC